MFLPDFFSLNKPNSSNLHQKGFTLMELLVTITIMAVLATIAIAIFSGAQQSARDTKRRQDINAIKNVLEQYYLKNGSYPPGNPVGVVDSCSTSTSRSAADGGPECSTSLGTGNWTGSVGGTGLYGGGKAAVDPINAPSGGQVYAYWYDPVNKKICAWRLETVSSHTIDVADYCLDLALN